MTADVTLTDSGATISIVGPWAADTRLHLFLRQPSTQRYLGRSGWTAAETPLPATLAFTETGFSLALDTSPLASLEPGMALVLEDVFLGLHEPLTWPALATTQPSPAETSPARQSGPAHSPLRVTRIHRNLLAVAESPRDTPTEPTAAATTVASSVSATANTSSKPQPPQTDAPRPPAPEPVAAALPSPENPGLGTHTQPAGSPASEDAAGSIMVEAGRRDPSYRAGVLSGLFLGIVVTVFLAWFMDGQSGGRLLAFGVQKSLDAANDEIADISQQLWTLREDNRNLQNQVATLSARLKEEGRAGADVPVPLARPAELWAALVVDGTGRLYGAANRASRRAAAQAATEMCTGQTGDVTCQFRQTFFDDCVGIARSGGGVESVVFRTTSFQAQRDALARCESSGGTCEVIYSLCSK